MKQISFILLLGVVCLLSCDKIKDAATIKIDTNMYVDLPVYVQDPNAIALKSTNEYSFTQSATASLMQNPQLQDYLDEIESIDIEDLVVTFDDIGAGETVKTISLSIAGIGVIATINDVTSSNLTHHPTVDTEKLKQAAELLTSYWQMTVVVTGNTNTAPMDFTVEADFNIFVKANPL